MNVLLPPFRLWLQRDYVGDARGRSDQWVSAWREDVSELLGGERSVWYWLHARSGKPKDEALTLTRLYWKIRDAGGCFPGDEFRLQNIPAPFQLDAKPLLWLFDALSAASWCVFCRAAPASNGDLCAWCAASPGCQP